MSREKAQRLPNWFLGNEEIKSNFERLLEPFKDQENLQFLEIGSFAGNSAVWLMENILTKPSCRLTCVDPWAGTLEQERLSHVEGLTFSYVEDAFDEQLEPYKDKLIKQKMFSSDYLMANRDKRFDFIYIDGDHYPQAIMLDGLLSWDLLKPNGILAFDDYAWAHPRGIKYYPRIPIDLFVHMYSEYSCVIQKGYQLWLRRV